MKKFNIKGKCVPEEDYMIDMTGRVTQIKYFENYIKRLNLLYKIYD